MVFKRLVPYLTSLFVLIGMVFAVFPTFAADDNFNYDFIISDEEMQNWESMNRSDIQAFLDDKNGKIADLKILDINGDRRLASEIIYLAAKEHKINPKYLLVKLQKEQSLITDSNPTDKQIDWATGYGVCDSCKTTDADIQKHKGFGTQVDSAAAIIRWYYDNLSLEPWIKRAGQTYIIDGETVRPLNNATAFLYTYTPHIHGNQNFWKLWQTWFAQVYPDGSLIRAAESPDIYILKDGKKQKIKSMSVFLSRYDTKMIMTVPSTELANYDDGPELSFPNYSILQQGSKYYLVDFDTIRPFASYEVVKKIGYNPGEFVEVEEEDLGGYQIGKIINIEGSENAFGRIVKLKEDNQLYYLKDNTYYSITDPQIAKINFPGLSEEKIKSNELQNYEPGEAIKFKDGTLFGIKGSNKIYVMEKGKRRHIASEEVFDGFGYNWNNIVWTDQITGMNHSIGQPIYLPSRFANKEKTDDSLALVVNLPDPTLETGKVYSVPDSLIEYIHDKYDTSLDAYLVADFETQEILAGKNIDVPRPIASFTKLMTAYILMKDGLDLEAVTTYNATDHKASYHQMTISENEQFRNKDLMYSMLVSSLNTPARMLADSVEEDENIFLNQMNEQAKDWGLEDTQFTDVYGYRLTNLSTPKEIMTIFLKADANPTIHAYLSTESYEYNEVKNLDGVAVHRDNHSNQLVNQDGLNFKILSSKTGYLNEAGGCLVMLIKRQSDNKQFIVIAMGEPNYSQRFNSPKKLADWIINEF